jgi:hypothetical protein
MILMTEPTPLNSYARAATTRCETDDEDAARVAELGGELALSPSAPLDMVGKFLAHIALL